MHSATLTVLHSCDALCKWFSSAPKVAIRSLISFGKSRRTADAGH